jgi:hypothetical protein
LQLVERRAGAHQVQVLVGRADDEFAGCHVAQAEAQGVLEKTGHVGLVFSGPFTQQVTGGVALLVEVDDQGAQTLAGADGGQVAGDGGFSNPTFLVEDDERHEAIPCTGR